MHGDPFCLHNDTSARISPVNPPAAHAGTPSLHSVLDTLLPGDSAATQELLADVAAGRTWQRVLPVPPPSSRSLVSFLGLRARGHVLGWRAGIVLP